MRKLIGVCLVILLFSCEQVHEKPAFTKSEMVAQNLIQICIDSTLQLDRGINSVNYSVDFRMVKDLNREGVERFLKTRAEASETDLDSLLRVKTRVSKYNFILPAAVIRFEKITVQNNGLILVELSKTRSAEGFIIAEILLRPYDTSFQCLSSKITRIG